MQSTLAYCQNTFRIKFVNKASNYLLIMAMKVRDKGAYNARVCSKVGTLKKFWNNE